LTDHPSIELAQTFDISFLSYGKPLIVFPPSNSVLAGDVNSSNIPESSGCKLTVALGKFRERLPLLFDGGGDPLVKVKTVSVGGPETFNVHIATRIR
jgi:hypothetical protein